MPGADGRQAGSRRRRHDVLLRAVGEILDQPTPLIEPVQDSRRWPSCIQLRHLRCGAPVPHTARAATNLDGLPGRVLVQCCRAATGQLRRGDKGRRDGRGAVQRPARAAGDLRQERSRVRAFRQTVQKPGDPGRGIADFPERQLSGLIGPRVRRQPQRHKTRPQQVGEVADGDRPLIPRATRRRTRAGARIVRGLGWALLRRCFTFWHR